METISASSPDELFKKSAPLLADAITQSFASKNRCVLGIVGGRSMPGLLNVLCDHLQQSDRPLDIFWLDERIDEEKNFTDALPYLGKLASKGVAIEWHPLVSMDVNSMQTEARECIRTLNEISGRPAFDIVVASAGEDGHICGLFPHHQALRETERKYILLADSPKPPKHRVTVTPALLTTAREAFLFFVGEKQGAYDIFLDEGLPMEECPAKLLTKLPKLTVCTSLLEGKHL